MVNKRNLTCSWSDSTSRKSESSLLFRASAYTSNSGTIYNLETPTFTFSDVDKDQAIAAGLDDEDDNMSEIIGVTGPPSILDDSRDSEELESLQDALESPISDAPGSLEASSQLEGPLELEATQSIKEGDPMDTDISEETQPTQPLEQVDKVDVAENVDSHTADSLKQSSDEDEDEDGSQQKPPRPPKPRPSMTHSIPVSDNEENEDDDVDRDELDIISLSSASLSVSNSRPSPSVPEDITKSREPPEIPSPSLLISQQAVSLGSEVELGNQKVEVRSNGSHAIRDDSKELKHSDSSENAASESQPSSLPELNTLVGMTSSSISASAQANVASLIQSSQPQKPIFSGVVVGFTPTQVSQASYIFTNTIPVPSAAAHRNLSPIQQRFRKATQYTLPPLSELPIEFQRKLKSSSKSKKRDKERDGRGVDSSKKDDWQSIGMGRWAATLKANPVYKRLARSTKCISTRDWNVRTSVNVSLLL